MLLATIVRLVPIVLTCAGANAAVGISPFFAPGSEPTDAVGLRYSMRIDYLKPGGNVLIVFGGTRMRGLHTQTHAIEINAFNYWVEYKDTGSVPWPPARNGMAHYDQGALWVAVSDYEREGLVGMRPMDKETLSLFPRMNSGVDNIPGLTKIENISQKNLLGKDIYIESTRGGVERFASPQANWGGRYRLEKGQQTSSDTLPAGTYRLWNVKAVIDGVEYAWAIAHPAEQSRYFAPNQFAHFVTEFFDLQRSQMRLYVWNPQILRKDRADWEDLAKWQFHYLAGTDPFGPRVTEANGRHVVELSNDKEPKSYILKKNDIFDLPLNPTIQWQSAESTPSKGKSIAKVTAVMDRPTSNPNTLVVRVAGTAVRGVDYVLDETVTLTIPAGEMATDLDVPLARESSGSVGRTIKLTFVSASPAAMAGRVTHVINIGSKVSGLLPADPDRVERERIIALITKLGGTYDNDPVTPGEPLNEVSFRGLPVDEKELAAISAIKSVEQLDLGRCEKINGGGLKHLKSLGRLKKLTLGYIPLSDVDLRPLTAIKSLEELDLGGCRKVTDQGLVNIKGLDRLKKLSLADMSIAGEGLEHLAGMSRLEHLNLALCNELTDEGLKHVGRLTALRQLDLASTGVSEAGLTSLRTLKDLRILTLVNVPVTDTGLGNLRGMRKLESLHLGGSKVTDAGVKKLQESLPKLQVYR